MNKFQEHYFQESEAKSFANEVKLLVEEEVSSVGINPLFISRLTNYLERRFPNYGDFDTAVGNEIRIYIKGDNAYIKKVKQRIHEIIHKAKAKFLRSIQDKVEKVKILPKAEPKPPQAFKPLAGVGDVSSGDSSYEPNP